MRSKTVLTTIIILLNVSTVYLNVLNYHVFDYHSFS